MEKKSKTVYISLPITGRDDEQVYQQNREAFMRLNRLDYPVITPLDLGIPKTATHEEAMKLCLRFMLQCDAVYFCDGYLGSKGCLTESMVAQACGLKQVYYVQTDEEIIKELGE